MGCIEANAQTLSIFRQNVENGTQLLEIASQRVTRANIVFQEQHDLRRRLGQDSRDALGDTRYARLDACSAMAPGMKYNVFCPEQESAPQRPAQQRHRFLPDCRVERSQVNQVGGVDHDRIKLADARRVCERHAGGRVVGGWTPSGGVAGKNLYGVAADLPRYLSGTHRFRVGGHVTAYAHELYFLTDLLDW